MTQGSTTFCFVVKLKVFAFPGVKDVCSIVEALSARIANNVQSEKTAALKVAACVSSLKGVTVLNCSARVSSQASHLRRGWGPTCLYACI